MSEDRNTQLAPSAQTDLRTEGYPPALQQLLNILPVVPHLGEAKIHIPLELSDQQILETGLAVCEVIQADIGHHRGIGYVLSTHLLTGNAESGPGIHIPLDIFSQLSDRGAEHLMETLAGPCMQAHQENEARKMLGVVYGDGSRAFRLSGNARHGTVDEFKVSLTPFAHSAPNARHAPSLHSR